VIPSGCSPPVLALYPDPRTGCLKERNEVGRHHNALLQQSLDGDGGVASQVRAEPRDDVLTVCCGGPGKNNFNGSVPCGDDPAASLYWDGVHFTEAANRYIACTWLRSMGYYYPGPEARKMNERKPACPVGTEINSY
jgi:hypothetical protein